MRLLVRWLVLAVAIWLATALIPGIEVRGGAGTYLWVALLFGLVNAVVGPVLRLLALPFTVLTLGLFALVVNAALLGITARLTEHLDVSGFWSAVAAAVVISLASAAMDRVVREVGRDREPRP
ncbi:putative membrane protein [Motilibacter rhizosphaerae]|uniref:Putative membrane protein n=1 Tax=Motilibacter rhizosphaerae TaxID=598652 RepID=A0A4V2F4K6_9ACTN|nr:phage holin family protein [Motilibacter rhizosphaerae]RZS89649.1 putative membrane protein [Motilibacter rhizosphaerae]